MEREEDVGDLEGGFIVEEGSFLLVDEELFGHLPSSSKLWLW